eukprot:TRINITY_DN10599_c0_g1_i1.p2 TRINITY_DN10599_c0_g1~~TRINITY_DN10599_c0_g1_i1.p2  ORF type:complete len:163 (-),score=63.02 TRINITY_DN10599_c0_g1_i1:334-822(-)
MYCAVSCLGDKKAIRQKKPCDMKDVEVMFSTPGNDGPMKLWEKNPDCGLCAMSCVEEHWEEIDAEVKKGNGTNDTVPDDDGEVNEAGNSSNMSGFEDCFSECVGGDMGQLGKGLDEFGGMLKELEEENKEATAGWTLKERKPQRRRAKKAKKAGKGGAEEEL